MSKKNKNLIGSFVVFVLLLSLMLSTVFIKNTEKPEDLENIVGLLWVFDKYCGKHQR